MMGGFTMVEVVLMLGIIVFISSIVLANFPSVSGSINVQKTAQGFALNLRRVQNQALAVRAVQGPSGPVVPPAVGINITTAAQTTYIMFADMNTNRVYDAASDIIIETVSVESRARLFELRDELNNPQTVINIVFTAPTADATIYNVSTSIGLSALIRFRADSGGIIRSVRVRTSGQIVVE